MSRPSPALTDTVGALASGLPGAAGLFRDMGVSLCCGAGKTLAEVAAARGCDAQELLGELGALAEAAERNVPADTVALIDHIERRYHATHRTELAELIPLAHKVERVHAGEAEAPRGLGALLEAMRDEMEAHMAKEEAVLFPMMRAGGHAMIVHPIAAMRFEHASHADQLRGVEHITHGMTPPLGACRSWMTLYAGVEKFADDLVAHMRLENDVLFPRFGG